MFGYPGETIDDLRQTVAFLEKNRGKFGINGFYLFNPMPGTQAWTELVNMDKIPQDFDYGKLELNMLLVNDWNKVYYFNDDNVPRLQLKAFIDDIKKRFIK